MQTQKTCDHKSVGMLVWKEEKLLLIERMKPPFAFSPPAGHLDGNENFEEMAKIELFEETGLKTKSIKFLIEGKKENPCRRIDGTWHYWQIFQIESEGDLNRSLEETKQIKWVDKNELLEIAKRCEELQEGKILQEDWDKKPGLEPVWYEWMKELNII